MNKWNRFFNGMTTAFVAFTFLAMALARPSLAQRGGLTPEERAEQRATIWKGQLHLTDAQETQVRAILLERERQWEIDHNKVTAAAPAARPALRSAMQEHMRSYRDRLHAILTPEQQRAALRLREMRPMRSYQGRGLRGGGMGGGSMPGGGMRGWTPADSAKAIPKSK